MAIVNVLIRAELDIPDEWTLVAHATGAMVLQIGDQFVDFDIAPLVTTSAENNAVWTDADAKLVNAILDTVVARDSDITTLD